MIVLHRVLPSLVGLVLGCRCIYDSDAFWHLMLGRAVLRHHSRIVPEPTAHLAWTEPTVVKEWLWDVSTYALHELGGMTLLSLLPALFGAAIGYRAARLLEVSRTHALTPFHTALAVLGVCSTAEALELRPNLVFFVLLLGFIELAMRHVRATGRRRLASGIGLVLLELLWVQLHSSFVLGPALFVIVAADAHLTAWARRRASSRAPDGAAALDPRAAIRGDGALLLGMLVALTTSPYGWDLARLVLGHASGDATRHISDMQRFDWSYFAPLHWHVPFVIMLLWGLGALAPLLGARVSWLGLALGLLGAVLTFSAARFVFPWGLLSLPWASSGLDALAGLADARPRRRLQLAGCTLTAAVVLWSAARIDAERGPLFRLGLRDGDHPQAAARYLRQLPAGTSVFSEYMTGASLGFWLDGHARTFVDSRTPLYYDDTDWAVARDMLASSGALELAFARYGFGAAVVSRGSSACSLLAEGGTWVPIVVEANVTTFVRRDAARGDATVAGLAACGPGYLALDACRDGGAALRASLARLSSLGPTPFLRLLQVAERLQCRSGVVDLDLLPSEAASRTFRSSYRMYRAWALLAAGKLEPAVDAIDAALDDEDALAARVLLEPEAGELALGEARRLLEQATRAMDDNTPAALRTRLAVICQAQGDAECVRFHGLRALLFGDDAAREPLGWAAVHHPSARVRADLQRWLQGRPHSGSSIVRADEGGGLGL